MLMRVIRIDPDHIQARAALGYRRYGLKWRIGGNIPSAPVSRAANNAIDKAKKNSADKEANPSTTKKVSKVSKAGEKKTKSTTSTPGSSSKTTKKSVTTQTLDKKISFANKAAEKLKLELNTREDSDFLIHTPYKANSIEVRTLVKTLKSLKKLVQEIVGTRSGSSLWPQKLQLFLFRAKSECVRFAEIIDRQRFPDHKGFYDKDEHAVFHKIRGEQLGLFLAESALENLGGSDRMVSWWLKVGIAEYIASKTAEGIENGRSKRALDLVASILESDPESLNATDLLISLQMGRRNQEVIKAQTLTIITFLNESRRNGIQKFITEMTGEKAPGKPVDYSDDSSSQKNRYEDFIIEFLAHQEFTFKKTFRMSIVEFDKKWKTFILEEFKKSKKKER